MTAEVQVFQFVGLLSATEYNAEHAALDRGIDAQTVNAMNTLLMAYAALEALVMETALVLYPALYSQRDFRRAGIEEQFRRFLEAAERATEETPTVVSEVSAHRIALTHSEPDNQRSAFVGEVISATDAARFAALVRQTAEWLWQGARPGPVAAGFDEPNCFLQEQ